MQSLHNFKDVIYWVAPGKPEVKFLGFSDGSLTKQGKKISMERNNSQTTKQKLPTIVSKYWETVHKVPIVIILHWIFPFFML